MKVNNIFCLIFLIFAFIGCSNTTRNKELHESTTNSTIKIVRFDRDIYQYLTQPDNESQANLIAKYPALLPAFGISTTKSDFNKDKAAFFHSLQNYFSHPMLKGIYKTASYETFEDISAIENTLSNAEFIIRQKMPNYRLPQFAIHVSGFKVNTIIVEGMISISCDKYLGEDYPLYKQFFEPYQRQQMKQENISRDYLKAWLLTDVKRVKGKDELLNSMIEEGKTLYILSILLPEFSTNDLIGYTNSQMSWCKENEKKVWERIIKQKDLFSQEAIVISKYIDDAPYTKPISEQSPGRIGCWLGWQIVNKYMQKSNSSIDDLIATDAQSILKLSKYNP